MKFRFYGILLLLFIASTLTGCDNVIRPPHPGEPTLALTASTPTQQQTPLVTLTPTVVYEGAFCAYSNGTVSEFQVPSTVLSHPLKVKVYLPPCYNTTRNPGYPVLYMLHGQSFDETQWDNLGIDEAADAMISSGEIQPLIIVMPGEDKWLENALSSRFGPALINQVIPWVDANYPTCPERACRALGGLSRGAAWAMRLGILHPELFTALGGHSLALFDGDVNYLPVLLTRMDASLRPQIYLDVGDKDRWKDSMTVFVAKLEYIQMNPVFLVQPGGHNEDYWREHTPEYLRWYASQLKQP